MKPNQSIYISFDKEKTGILISAYWNASFNQNDLPDVFSSMNNSSAY